MIYYLVGRIEVGSLATTLAFTVESEDQFLSVLQGCYPDERPLVEGDTFKYITNGMHWMAAGYPDDVFIDGYKEMRAPAHFNPPFFHVLRSSKFIKQEGDTTVTEARNNDRP